MGVTLVLSGEKSEDIGSKYIGRDNENRFSPWPDLNTLVAGQNFIEVKAFCFGNSHVAAVIEVKAEFSLNVSNRPGIPVNDKIHQLRESP
jgi:hypothetical protein